MTSYALLPNRRLLFLTGEDTVSFLQGVITNDVSRLDDGQMLYTALLSPQGKFLHDFFISRWRGGYWIDCEASRTDDLLKRLMLYRLRASVTMEPAAADLGVGVLWGQSPSVLENPDMLVTPDPRLSQMGMRAIGSRAAIEQWCQQQGMMQADAKAYDEWRISKGVPDGAQDMIMDKSLIMEFGFEQLHGVDFKKGCYVGQEVTARSKFRAHLKKCLHVVQSESGLLPPPGTEIRAGEMELGQMCSSSGYSGLALLRTQELDKTHDMGLPLRAGEAVMSAHLPLWMEETPEA